MQLNGTVLIIDDEVEVGHFFQHLLTRRGLKVQLAHTGKEARQHFLTISYHVALIDLKLPDAGGLDLLFELKTAQPDCEAIIMTGYGTTKTAVKAIQFGAYDYLEKPFEDITEIENLIENAIISAGQRLNNPDEQPIWAKAAKETGLIVGKTPRMQQLMNVATKIAGKNLNVLIQGETGTGKELLARFIHEMSPRKNENFVAVNCGALPENLLESELFGHEKGAFTSAVNLRKGIFELADKGSLFLDEIGEAILSIQVKLLRVLETGEFMRIGGEKPVRTNVRLITATHVDLETAVREKAFREDLFYRLDVARLELPPLRERKEDIPLLVHHVLNRDSRSENVSLQLSPEAFKLMQDYNWPGNIRELVHVVEQAKAFTEGTMILPSHLPGKLQKAQSSVIKLSTVPTSTSALTPTPTPNILLPLHSSTLSVQAADEVVDVSDHQNPGSEILAKSLLTKVKEFYNLMEDFQQSRDSSNLLKAYEVNRQIPTELLQLMQSVNLDVTPLSLNEVEAQAIMETLNFFENNIADSARSLGIGRNTLYRKIKDYNIKL